jgi:hypothetical protein
MDPMGIAEMLKGLVEKIALLQTALVDAEAAAASIAKEAYDKGFAEGVASVPPVPEDVTPFTQADIDAAVALAVEPLNLEIASLKMEMDALKVQLEEGAEKAIAGFKAELLAKYEAQQVAETEGETGFMAFLK